MSVKKRFFIASVFQLLLIGVGAWAIYMGKTDLGVALIVATCAVFIVRRAKSRKLQKLEQKGMNPYDERTWTVAGKAAYSAYYFFVLAGALIVIIGSIFGPSVQVNFYNTLGLIIAVQVLLYSIFYYFYNNKM